MIYLRVLDVISSCGRPGRWTNALIPASSVQSIGNAGFCNCDAVALTVNDGERLQFTPIAWKVGQYDIRAYTTELIKAIRTACDWSVIRGYADDSEKWDIITEE